MNFKKSLIYLLILLIAVSLSGCIGSDDSTPDNSMPVSKTSANNSTQNSGSNNSATNNNSKTYSGPWSISLNEVYAGSDVPKLMEEANRFNFQPNSNETAFFVLVTVTCNSLESSFSNFSHFVTQGVLIEGDGIFYEPVPIPIMPESYPEIENGAAMSPGDSITGWVYFIVPSGAVSTDSISITYINPFNAGDLNTYQRDYTLSL